MPDEVRAVLNEYNVEHDGNDWDLVSAILRAGKWKARDEMNEEAAMRKFKEFWDRPFADKDQDTLRAVLDAAWGPAKKIET